MPTLSRAAFPLAAVIGHERVLLSFPADAGTMDGDVVRYRPADFMTRRVPMPAGEPDGRASRAGSTVCDTLGIEPSRTRPRTNPLSRVSFIPGMRDQHWSSLSLNINVIAMSARFLILHGLENHRPPQHWQFLLAAGLVERGHEVRYPALPEPDSPELSAWLDVLRGELAELGTEQLTVVCHSLACLLWFHFAEQDTRSLGPIRRLLLVSPPDSAVVPDTAASFRISTFDAARVAGSTAQIAIACSDADPYNPSGAQAMYGDSLSVIAHLEPRGAHLTPDSGYGPWPWVQQWCLAGEAG